MTSLIMRDNYIILNGVVVSGPYRRIGFPGTYYLGPVYGRLAYVAAHYLFPDAGVQIPYALLREGQSSQPWRTRL